MELPVVNPPVAVISWADVNPEPDTLMPLVADTKLFTIIAPFTVIPQLFAPIVMVPARVAAFPINICPATCSFPI